MNGLLVGRFQPFHLGHIEAVRYALTRCESLWLCIGSSNLNADAKNPFSVIERQEMIESSLSENTLARIRIFHIPDFDDHKKWMTAIDSTVPDYGIVFTNDNPTAEMFAAHGRQISGIEFLNRDSLEGLRIRAVIASGGELGSLVPNGTLDVLDRIGAKTRLLSFNYK